MRRFLIIPLLLSAQAAHAADLTVVTTLPDLAAIAKDVGGEHVSVRALVGPNQDPHYVDARPSFMVTLNRADLVIINGCDLEVGWLPNLLVSARNPKVQSGAPGYLDVSTGVRRLQVPTARIDRAMGDIHPGGNPHFLFDPRRAKAVAKLIATRMAELDREHATAFRSNASRLSSSLDEIAKKYRERVQKLPESKRRIVSYHQSLVYLTDWLGVSSTATLEPRPGIPPSPSHIAQVLEQMRATKTRVIMQEGYYQTGPSQTLAQLAGAELYVFAGGADVDKGESYPARIEKLAGGLYERLAK